MGGAGNKGLGFLKHLGEMGGQEFPVTMGPSKGENRGPERFPWFLRDLWHLKGLSEGTLVSDQLYPKKYTGDSTFSHKETWGLAMAHRVKTPATKDDNLIPRFHTIDGENSLPLPVPRPLTHTCVHTYTNTCHKTTERKPSSDLVRKAFNPHFPEAELGG